MRIQLEIGAMFPTAGITPVIARISAIRYTAGCGGGHLAAAFVDTSLARRMEAAVGQPRKEFVGGRPVLAALEAALFGFVGFVMQCTLHSHTL